MTTDRRPSEGTPQVNFRAGELLVPLSERAGTRYSLAEVARRDLDRYYYLLRTSLPTFTVAEASLIVDALNGTLTEPHTASLLWAAVADSLDDNLEDGLAEKWDLTEADAEALVARLRQFTPFEQIAIADACERYWRGITGLWGGDVEGWLRRVGLVRAVTPRASAEESE